MKEEMYGLGFLVFLAVVAVSFFISKWEVDSKPNPDIYAPSENCDVSDFVKEYDISTGYENSIVHNELSYRLLYDLNTGTYFPIVDSSCSLELGEDSAGEAITHNYLVESIDGYDERLYRELAICYGVPSGARPICDLTSGTNEIIGNPAVELAAGHEHETISVVSRLVPNGWKRQTISTTKGLIRLTKELKGPGAVSIVFEVADMSACFLKDSIAVYIYDYSLTVGDDIWYRLKNKNSFTGSDQDLYEVNAALQELMKHPDAPAQTSNLAGALLGGKDCFEAEKHYVPQLASINKEITESRSNGEAHASKFSQFIMPIHSHAKDVRDSSLSESNATEMLSLGGHIMGVLVLTKSWDYLESKLHHDNADALFQRGLFYSAEEEYGAFSASAGRWWNKTIWDYALSGIAWLLFASVFVVGMIWTRQQI